MSSGHSQLLDLANAQIRDRRRGAQARLARRAARRGRLTRAGVRTTPRAR